MIDTNELRELAEQDMSVFGSDARRALRKAADTIDRQDALIAKYEADQPLFLTDDEREFLTLFLRDLEIDSRMGSGDYCRAYMDDEDREIDEKHRGLRDSIKQKLKGDSTQ